MEPQPRRSVRIGNATTRVDGAPAQKRPHEDVEHGSPSKVNPMAPPQKKKSATVKVCVQLSLRFHH
jgi:hypothetical protein